MTIKRVNNYMALLRNLRNICDADVSKKHINKVAEALTNREAVLRSKQLPFRFYSARTSIHGKNEILEKAVNDAMEISLSNLPTFSGNVMSLCDNSGSAHGSMTSQYGTVKVSEIANLTAAITSKISENGHVGVFGDKLSTFEADKTVPILDIADKANTLGASIGMGTEHGLWLFWEKALAENQHWDHVFIYSDLQCGHGRLYGNGSMDKKYSIGRRYIDIPTIIADYRNKVNPNVIVYTVQVSGYDTNVLPEVYDRTVMLSGWSDAIFKYADKMSSVFND